MDIRRLVPRVKTWMRGEIACAAGLAALSAAAGYCLYRYLRRGSTPPELTQPPHEPEDVLEEPVHPPSDLQVVKPNLQPPKDNDDLSAVVMDVEVQSDSETRRSPSDQDSTEAELFTAQDVEPNLQLMNTEHHQGHSAEVLDVVEVQPDSETLRSPSAQDSTEAELFSAQDVEPNLQVMNTEHHQGHSAEVLDVVEVQSDSETLRSPSDQDSTEAELFTAQDVEPNLQLMPTEHHQGHSAEVLDVVEVQPDSESLRSSSDQDSTEAQLFSAQDVEPNLQLMVTERHPDEHPDEVLAVSEKDTECVSRVETSTNVPHEDRSQTSTKASSTDLHVGEEQSSHSEAESQPDSEESLTPEEIEVPFISDHLAERRVAYIGLKLHALRQAFSTLLASMLNQNFLFVAGKEIVMRLAALNNQNPISAQLTYESLIRFLRRPSNQDSIKAELFGAQLHHYNMLDVFFELLLFGFFKKGLAPVAIEGGFLDHLYALVNMWDVDVRQPAGDVYFTVLIDQLTALCEELFSQLVELYSDPAALASAVLCLLRQHVQLMMDRLE